MTQARRLFAAEALLPEGWRQDVLIEVMPEGMIGRVTAGAPSDGAERASGPVLPGMPNLHSHAFQRGMAGLAQQKHAGDDDFWSWREVMYGFLARLTPHDLEAIAAQVYVEMLKAGYTSVAEFHYLHHAPDGRPYDNPSLMAEHVIEAARSTGIGLTLLPVLYGHGGFGGQPAAPRQSRFLLTGETFRRLVQNLRAVTRGDPLSRIGIAPHSLRAVTEAELQEATADLTRADPSAPIHIHIAEQEREVSDCVAWSGAGPVDWLLDHLDIDDRWCLVHATHMTGAESDRLAATGAVVGLCPSTEADLGDGVFPAQRFFAAGGAWGVGSDSQVGLDPFEELRLLEYEQRVISRRRCVLASEPSASVGAALYRSAVAGGTRALAQPIGRIATGHRADLIVLDGDSAALAARHGDALLDAAIFAPGRNLVRDVMVSGHWRIKERHHEREHEVGNRYRAVLRRLLAGA
jgi:formimidoylglutamate deiminase